MAKLNDLSFYAQIILISTYQMCSCSVHITIVTAYFGFHILISVLVLHFQNLQTIIPNVRRV